MRKIILSILPGILSAAGVLAQSTDTAVDRTWVTNGSVYAISATADKVYIGGDFTLVGPSDWSSSVKRNHIACIDAATGIATAWNPDANNTVLALCVQGGSVYAGGTFDSIGGQPRSRIASIDFATGTPKGWNPSANNAVYALASNGSSVYAGGTFTAIGGKPRNRIACMDTLDGWATDWNPNADNTVYSLIVLGTSVYAGGYFMNIGDYTRHCLACIDAVTGQSTPWDPRMMGYVYSMVITGNHIYVGGDFMRVADNPGWGTLNIACIDLATGLATDWSASADSAVYALCIHNGSVYAGGNIEEIGGQSRNKVACLDTLTGQATSWNPNANVSVRAISANENSVYVGGLFSTINGKKRDHFAQTGIFKPSALIPRPGASATKNLSILISTFKRGRGLIRMTIPHTAQISLILYDIRGRRLKSLCDRTLPAGEYSVFVSSKDLGTGLFLLRLRGEGLEKTVSVALIK